VALATALALTSCLPRDDTDPPGSATSSSATSPATRSPVPSPDTETRESGAPQRRPAQSRPAQSRPAQTLPEQAQPPPDGACYLLDFDDATAPTNDEVPVGCAKRHTGRSYYVGRLDTVVDGHLLAVDSRVAREQAQKVCTRRLREYVGGSPRDRRLSRLKPVWFGPTIEQSDLGASWVRCDVVAVARGTTLAALPRRVRGILDRPEALDRVGICGTAAPGARAFERIVCGRRHAWKALTTIDIGNRDRYPGVAAVRRAGQDRCRDVVRRRAGSATGFRYGWEWPTRQQWRSGQRYGYCWAPD
jgi:hypothetical protein